MKRQKIQPQEVLRDFRDKDGEWKPIHRLTDGTKLECNLWYCEETDIEANE